MSETVEVQVAEVSLLVDKLRRIADDLATYLPEQPVGPEGRVLWFRSPPGGKEILILDTGYRDQQGTPIGNIHIYEKKEVLPATELSDQTKKLGPHMEWRVEGLGQQF